MITLDKEKLINLIQTFISQGADDQIHLGYADVKEYRQSIEFQLKQIEIILHDDLKKDCNCYMCNYYADLQNENDLNSLENQPIEQ